MKMKTLHKFLTLALLVIAVTACKEKPPTPPFKLSTIDRGNSNKHIYTYDANGKITQMVREFDGTGSGTIFKYVYTFTYDAAGLLIKSSIKLDSKDYGTETYSYTNRKISKATYVNTDGSKGVNNLIYNTAGQITEFTFETGDPNADGKQYFEFDSFKFL